MAEDISYSATQEVVKNVYLKGGAQLRRYENYKHDQISAIYADVNPLSKDAESNPRYVPQWKEIMWKWRGHESDLINEWNNP